MPLPIIESSVITSITSLLLDGISGIGIARKKKLFKCFGSIEGIRNATVEQLTEISKLPPKQATEIFNYFHINPKHEDGN